MNKVTIEDISRHTGLSRGTVSRALNNRPDISAQTKERVLEACRQLNYVPSHAARSLATGRCYAAAVVVPTFRDPLAADILRGIVQAAGENRYTVHVTELGDDGDAALTTLAEVAHDRVDCVLVAGRLPAQYAARLTELAEGRPIALAAGDSELGGDRYLVDYAEAGRLLARHLSRAGQSDLLYVVDRAREGATASRDGFSEVCAERGIDASRAVVEINAAQQDWADTLRDRLPEVRALAANSDLLALAMMSYCRALGRHPGRDLLVAGQGNSAPAVECRPQLTSVDYCGAELGRRAFVTAVQRVTQARTDAVETVYAAPILIERESTRT